MTSVIEVGDKSNVPQPSSVLEGKYIILRQVNPDEDYEELFENSHGEHAWIWQYMFSSPSESKEAFHKQLQNAVTNNVTFTVIDKQSNQKIGMCSYLNVVPDMRRLELGSIWYTPRFHKTYANTETCYLLLKHAFDDLKYRRVEWKCDNRNDPSKVAAQKLGFTFEGLFRQHMIIKGLNRDTAYFSIIDSEWNDHIKQNLLNKITRE